LNKTEKILVDHKADSEEKAASTEAVLVVDSAVEVAADLDVAVAVDSAAVEAVASTEAADSVEAVLVVDSAVEEVLTTAQEKCIQQNVLNVVRTAKFLSNLQKENQFIAKNVL
jgi:hypothetical protein